MVFETIFRKIYFWYLRKFKTPRLSYKLIQAKDLYAFLVPRLHTYNIYVADEKYRVYSKQTVLRFLKENSVDERKYVPETHDCDDFSRELWSSFKKYYPIGALGIAWSNHHAFNFVLIYEKDKNIEICLIEPQTDELFKLSDIKKDKKYYPIRFAFI